jgi:hypothetical protein
MMQGMFHNEGTTVTLGRKYIPKSGVFGSGF